MRSLLSLIPVASHLAPGGLVAVWVTNAARFSDLLLAPGSGIFSEWLVELVGEWTWLKVTAEGEPVVSPHSAWRKPWERLLIARRRGDGGEKMPVKGKVIVAVPDVHSRKPCLRGLLTAGWWGWGNQALLYQHKDHWVDVDAADVNVDVGVDADATAEGESSLKTPAS
ncbi:hypothetical protein B0T17DRAFT_520332 [Bombardia bombarda]|uniref:Methyltransferase n=1 Tax=Bombardia bombarda TaxID=252184 RepID=A0AA39XMU7_9PEZI|nr:hypothetical protein B0T17DRAFT_520332 [Bombardia bombarda]